MRRPDANEIGRTEASADAVRNSRAQHDLRGPARGRRAHPHAPARQSGRRAAAGDARQRLCRRRLLSVLAAPAVEIRRAGIRFPQSWAERPGRCRRTTTTRSSAAISNASCRRSARGSAQKPTAGIFHSMSGRTAMKHADRDRLALGRAGAVRSAERAAAGPSALCGDGGVREQADRMGEEPPPALRVDRGTRRGVPASRATQRWVAGAHELMARSVLRKRRTATATSSSARRRTKPRSTPQALTLNLWPKASEFGGPVKLIGCDPNFKGAPATGPANQALGIEGGYDYSFVRRHRPSAADREARGVHPADAGVSRQARAGVILPPRP